MFQQESQNTEYKRSWHDDYLKWICGFANAIGGYIYIGKDDKGDIVHLENCKKLMEDIPNKIRNSMGILCDVQLHEEQGSNFISIAVRPSSVAVSLRGRYYYRTGSTNIELTGVELNDFLLKKSGKTWDDIIEERATINDIDEVSFQVFLDDCTVIGRLPRVDGLTTIQILEKLNLAEHHKIKRAAIILFGKDPNWFYPNIRVNIGRFGKDSTELKFQEIVEGNLIQMLDEVLVQLNHKFLIRPVSFVGMKREEKNLYPTDALREMLLNAMVHRLQMGAHIQLRVYDNRLSIWNEGGLPFGLSIEQLLTEHNSQSRNPKIARACFMAGYIDTWGRGTLKIINSCKLAGLPEPQIKEQGNGIEVTLFAKQEDEIAPRLRNDCGMIAERLRNELDQNSLLVLNAINKNPQLTTKQIAEEIGKSQRTVESSLKTLRDKGVITRVGANLGGYWKINE